MRRWSLAIILLVLLLLSGVGRSSPLFFPLSEHTMAKGVSPGALPLMRTYTFCADDEQAVSWLLFFRDTGVHSVEWRWYRPEGRTYTRTFSVIPPIDGYAGLWAAPVWTCLPIQGTDAAEMPGIWKVDVIVDFRKIITQYFTIETPGAC